MQDVPFIPAFLRSYLIYFSRSHFERLAGSLATEKTSSFERYVAAGLLDGVGGRHEFASASVNRGFCHFAAKSLQQYPEEANKGPQTQAGNELCLNDSLNLENNRNKCPFNFDILGFLLCKFMIISCSKRLLSH